MSVITDVPKWQRILKAIDLPVQFLRMGLLALIIWAWKAMDLQRLEPFGFELFPKKKNYLYFKYQ